ncbi:MAG: polyribonucleotide nucleotidyltransferase, partial [Candidatus Omnitrophica bacterium]|nr:polyribonucleotide nucleotidyltransferase [Candidatus Omnitrophota bacterium]
DIQKQLREKCGKPKREDIVYTVVDKGLCQRVSKKASAKLREIFQLPRKQQRIEALEMLTKELVESEKSDESEDIEKKIELALGVVEKETVRDLILNKKKRVDGRKFDEIRPLSSEINILPRTHGSGLFTRGETQALAVVTLGTSDDEQKIETLMGEDFKSFMLHYNFPPFSVGETSPMRGPGRREIGHGALAEKALKFVLPTKDIFPYTIRLVSEILESNGSSSMATVCAGSLALMAGGVPISEAVGGIAMGVVVGNDGHSILTDIAGAEDHYGDMDFKVAGTRTGVTAVQMDLKVKGISYKLLEEAFAQAKKARIQILDHMKTTISEPSSDVAETAPRIITIKINPAKIREVIGPGGKVIRKIVADTGADINIEDDGTCQIASNNKEALQNALAIIKGITEEPEVGRVYKGRIVKLMNFGAFCEFLPGQEGLIHVSEIADKYVKDVSEHLQEGQEVRVKLIEIDEQGRFKLSMKQVIKEEPETLET